MVTKKKKAPSTARAHTRHISKTPTHFMIKRSLLSYAVIVFVFFALLSMSAYLVDRMIVSRNNQVRYNEITKIYKDLNLGDDYRVASTNIFGDKRVYSYDSSRTHSSSVEYGRNASVQDTIDDLRNKAEQAGFSYVQTEYEGSVSAIYEYKNDNGNWIRIRAVPKEDQDDVIYGTSTFNSTNIEEISAMSPTYVTIKVNLDDNNE